MTTSSLTWNESKSPLANGVSFVTYGAISEDARRRYRIVPSFPSRWEAVCRSYDAAKGKWDDFRLNVYNDVESAKRACEGYEESFA